MDKPNRRRPLSGQENLSKQPEPALFGVLLTQDEHFIKFEIDAEQSGSKVYKWCDITADQNLGEHNRGIGVGDGALAIQVLNALNASQETSSK